MQKRAFFCISIDVRHYTVAAILAKEGPMRMLMKVLACHPEVEYCERTSLVNLGGFLMSYKGQHRITLSAYLSDEEKLRAVEHLLECLLSKLENSSKWEVYFWNRHSGIDFKMGNDGNMPIVMSPEPHNN